MLLASACVCCEITHHSGYDLSLASACVCCAITHDRGTICYWHRRVSVQRSHITAGTICYWHRRVFVVRSHITGVHLLRASARVCSEITHHIGYDLLQASACVCCEITHHRGYHLLRASACVCSGSRRVATDIYIYMGTQTSYLSICLSINLPLSILCIIGKKAPKSYPRHSCCCLAKSTVIVDENSS